MSTYSQIFGKEDPIDASVTDWAEHGRAGGVQTGQSFKFVRKVDEKTLIEAADSTTTYIGKASFGTAKSASSWFIKRITVSGTLTTVELADGNAEYDNIWDNRASLSYS